MSRCVSIETISDPELQVISNDLNISIPPPKFSRAPPEVLSVFDVENNHVYLPFSYGKKYARPPRSFYPCVNVTFEGSLRDQQEVVKDEAISTLNKCGSVTIAAYPSFGKTSVSIYIATRIKLPTLILCHRIVLIEQWKNAIQKFCPNARVQILNTKDPMEEADFYIMNASNVPKRNRKFYDSIGMLIVDESHLIMAKSLSKCMSYIIPRYVLGLSATPYRYDGLDILFDLYFGTDKIERKLYRPHTVYKIETGFTPVVSLSVTGRMDWGKIIQQQSDTPERNELIVNIVKEHPQNTFLILCKRVSQARYLVQRLTEEKEQVTSLIGKEQTYDENSRILVGIAGKCSVGFDHPKLNTLLLAVDFDQYFIQALGRVFRTREVEPTIFDLVDKNSVLEKHFKSRTATYLEHGGNIKIKKINKE